ncbi:hypothetical protein [Nocardiopsis alba]|uniref:Integral membrane protein n=2 Tax=Nocardiopsis alba TaxID=53437 RepID=A0ABV5DYF1_9ACTN|nr:hypothetical protein [Nocardiopsis alba]AFR08674.1 putative membrane protein [Nocardiopsis alba ATCC BAA-2165]
MSAPVLLVAGIVLLTVVGIAYGGSFLLRVVDGGFPVNDLQRSYFRAGHAHAGVLVILGLVVAILTDQPTVPGWGAPLGLLVLLAAVLMPAGFFLSVVGRDPAKPNGFRLLIGAGAASLVVGLVGAGIALILAGAGLG